MSKTWQNLPPMPGPLIAIVDPRTGALTPLWYQYFSGVDRVLRGVTTLSLNDLADIDVSAPADGQVLTFVAADNAWEGV